MNIFDFLQNASFHSKENMDVLANELSRLSKLYYAGTPEVPDSVFDQAYNTLKAFSPEHPYFQKVNPEFETSKAIVHLKPMLSIQTEVDHSFNGLRNFDNKIRNALTMGKVYYVLEFKYDGLGLNLFYRDGYLIHITTRGDQFKGEAVTHALPLFGRYIPRFIPGLKGNLEIRGEALMAKEEFKKINEELKAEGKKLLANPRNAVAGTVRTLDIEKVKDRHLMFFPYGVGGGELPPGITSQVELLNWFKNFFILPETKFVSTKTCTWDIGYLYDIFKAVGNNRKDLDFAIDGVVYKVNDFSLQEKLGFRSTEPCWAMAQKYPPEQALTELLAIDVQVGRTGKLTPVARVLPIYVGGTTINNITLHNVFDLRRRGVRVGDQITIQRAGDVIPEIEQRPQHKKRITYLPNFRMPSFCPCCLGPVKRPKGEREYYCTNKACPEQVIGSLIHFVSRSCLNIKGLGEETIRNLVTNKRVSFWLDLYTLTEADFIQLGGLAPANAPKVLTEIENSKKANFWNFIHGLGIPNVGEGTSKRIASNFSIHDLPVSYEKLLTVKDIGPLTAESVARYFADTKFRNAYYYFIYSLPGVSLKMPSAESDKLKGLVILLTGSFKSMKRDEIKQMIEDLGGKVSSSVTGSTTLVVAGEASTTHKVEKAKKLGIPILNEQEFLNSFK